MCARWSAGLVWALVSPLNSDCPPRGSQYGCDSGAAGVTAGLSTSLAAFVTWDGFRTDGFFFTAFTVVREDDWRVTFDAGLLGVALDFARDLGCDFERARIASFVPFFPAFPFFAVFAVFAPR